MKNDYISDIHKKDKLILHPYENLKERGTYNRKLIVKSDNIIYTMKTANVTLMDLVECGATTLVMAIKKWLRLLKTKLKKWTTAVLSQNQMKRQQN